MNSTFYEFIKFGPFVTFDEDLTSYMLRPLYHLPSFRFAEGRPRSFRPVLQPQYSSLSGIRKARRNTPDLCPAGGPEHHMVKGIWDGEFFTFSDSSGTRKVPLLLL